MRKKLSILAIILILAGIACLGGSVFAGAALKSVGMSAADWESMLSSRGSAIDKVEKMVSSMRGNIEKWDEADPEWTASAAALQDAATQAIADMRAGNGDNVWKEAFAEWSASVTALNALEGEEFKPLQKSVKGLNRQIKTAGEAFSSWEESQGSIAGLNFDPDASVEAFCIKHQKLFLYIGILLILAGIFVFPAVREAIAKNRQAVGYLFVAPALIFLLLFVAYPIVYNIILSFKNVDITNINVRAEQSFVGLKNYVQLFTDVDGQMTGSIVNTLIFTVGSIFFQFIIGFLLALLFRNKFPGCGFVRGAIMISWLIPVTVSGLLFKFMFSMNGGIINQFLNVVGLESIEWLYSVDYAMPAVIMANIWIGIPFNMILLLTGLTTIPAEVYESAEIDGARGLKRLFRVTVPMIRPAIMSVLTLGFVYTFKVFDLVKVMTSGGPVNRTQLVSIYAYKLAFEKYEYSLGAAAATIMFIILLVEGLFYIKAIKEDEEM